jgi:transcriptional regulator with XRE-family HTH domain
MTIGERVAQARDEAGLSPSQLARRVGISRAAISQIENGSTKSPNAKNLQKIAEVTGVRSKWLLHGKGLMREMNTKSEIPTEDLKDLDTPTLHSGGITEVSMKQRVEDLVEAFALLDDETQNRVVMKVQALAFRATRSARNFPKRQSS